MCKIYIVLQIECSKGQKCHMRYTGIDCLKSPCPSFVPLCVPIGLMPCDVSIQKKL